ncbi:class I SAM-dependent methyltransferase [Actinosynnema pretiosum subsp. pretiosum]|uniref:Methyltransferase type 12 n=2 Tax=Actinosynnema TaxID=40566 RepID=C6WQ91_ACTMD|nr:class I SAM-dependent methyltransferase [Actinosynnema mirum]ACU36745.1 Methyltransferase type 12 [Actinosynnema mirum DSM 43827]QUF05637.1 class I SAM-dependent methyltransferase [Actinosynnema pretiosum subsp. pretiosum]
MVVHDIGNGADPQSFDSFALEYDRFCEFEDHPVWGWVTDAGVRPGGRALDAGCGSGRRCRELADHYDEVLGVDLSAPLVELARARRPHPRVRYEVADLADVDGGAEGFDLVFSSTTLHHVPDLDDALRKLKSLVRPGGCAVLVDNVADRPTPPAHVYRVGALLSLPGDVRAHGWRAAVWLFRFRAGGPWLEHLLTDRYLSRPEFERRYGSVFPGASFVDRGFAHALVWRRDG